MLQELSLHQLAVEANQLVEAGYRPAGGPLTMEGKWFAQAMWLPEPRERAKVTLCVRRRGPEDEPPLRPRTPAPVRPKG